MRRSSFPLSPSFPWTSLLYRTPVVSLICLVETISYSTPTIVYFVVAVTIVGRSKAWAGADKLVVEVVGMRDQKLPSGDWIKVTEDGGGDGFGDVIVGAIKFGLKCSKLKFVRQLLILERLYKTSE